MKLTAFLTSALDGGEPSHFNPLGKIPWCSLDRRVMEAQNQFTCDGTGRETNICRAAANSCMPSLMVQVSLLSCIYLCLFNTGFNISDYIVLNDTTAGE